MGRITLFLILFSLRCLALDLGTGGFGTTGFVIQDLGNADQGIAGTYYSNGRLVIAGYTSNGSNNDFTAIRLFPDGTVDTSFGSSGQARTNLNGLDDKAYSVTLDSFGRVLVAGETTTAGAGINFGLVRYDTNGILDTKFGSAGIVNTDFGGSITDIGQVVVINNQAQIIVGGYRDVGSSDVDFALARYMSNGALDTKFASGGRATSPVIASQNEYIRGIYFRSNNGFHVIGYTRDGSSGDFAVARYASNGLLDSTFGSVGTTVVAFGSFEDTAFDAAFDGNNRFLVLGTTHTGSNFDFALARYNSNGSLDSKFASAGLARRTCSSSQNDIGRGLAIFGSNDIMAVGQVSNGSNLDLCVMRLNSFGALDTKYDTDGIYTADLSGLDDTITGLAWDNVYYFTAIGSTTNASSGDFSAARISGNAGLAKSGDRNSFLWGSNSAATGALSFAFSTAQDIAYDVTWHTSNRILVSGSFASTDAAFIRLTPYGTLDSTFGSAGLSTVPTGASNSLPAYSLKVNSVNQVATTTRDDTYGYMLRVDTNGLLDSKFGAGNGHCQYGPQSHTSALLFGSGDAAFGIGNDGGFLLQITRLVSNCSYDAAFASSAFAQMTLTDGLTRDDLYDATFASNSRFNVCGPSACGGFVSRFLTDGAVDTTFATTGTVYPDAQTIVACKPDPRNNLVAFGETNGNCAVWRYASNGQLDTTFNTTGIVEIPWASGEGICSGAVQQNGKVVVGGHTDTPAVFRYSRLLSNGALDAPFHSNTNTNADTLSGTYEQMSRVAIDPRDMLFIVGQTFTSDADWAIQAIFP